MPQVIGQDDGTHGPHESGVKGESQSATGYGVVGITSAGFEPPEFPGQTVSVTAGVVGLSHGWPATTGATGVIGQSDNGRGVWGHSGTGPGVVAVSDSYRGVEARGNPAGFFDGDVQVTGNVNAKDVIIAGGDCAEDFDVADPEGIDAGTLVVMAEDGRLRRSDRQYDRRVVGVVAGAGDCPPGIVLNRKAESAQRVPVALVGRVYCKVDADQAPIIAGDLLTTSAVPGHAMRVSDPLRASGAVVGKALCSQPAGRGLIPILVTLQ